MNQEVTRCRWRFRYFVLYSLPLLSVITRHLMKSLVELILAILLITMICPLSPLAQREAYTVVIDAGHDGHDVGTRTFRRREKDINLAIALLTRKYVEQAYPEIKVYMTRSTNVFVGLRKRASSVNRKKADFFVSIHASSVQSPNTSGTETYMLGLRHANGNLTVSERENQVVLLEKGYEETYEDFDPSNAGSYTIFEFIRNIHLASGIDIANEVQESSVKLGRDDRSVRQGPLLIIRKTTMPNIFMELGFITNKVESDYFVSQGGHEQLA